MIGRADAPRVGCDTYRVPALTYSQTSGNILVMRISIGNGGWVAVDDLGLPGPLFVRVKDVQGRLRVVEFYLDASSGEDAIDARDLRELPLSQVEAFINSEADAGAALIRHTADVLSPDISTLISYYATSFGNMPRQLAEGNWIAASFFAQFDMLKPGERAVVRKSGPGQYDLLTGEDARAALEADPGLGRVKKMVRQEKSKAWIGLRQSEREFRLSSGPSSGLTDEFLRDVYKAYRAADARDEPPNVAISEQTGYPVKTVQRWVYTARQRGIMPRGSKGRIG
jgi:hypothetical protein